MSYTIWDTYLLDGRTFEESPIANRSDTGWNSYIGKRFTFAESIFTNFGYAVRDSYPGE